MYFIFCDLEDLIALIYLIYFRKMKFKRKFPVSLLKKNVFIVLKEYGHTRISWIFNLNHNLIEIKLLPLKIENMKNELVSFLKINNAAFLKVMD